MGGGAAKDKVVIILPFPEPKAIVAALRRKFPHIDIDYLHPKETEFSIATRDPLPKGGWKDITVLFTFNYLPDSPKDDAPNLDFLQLMSAGSNHIQTHPIYTSTDITISTASGIHGPQIAEWVVLTALVQSHRYNLLHDLQKEHQWGKTAPDGGWNSVRDMVGRRIGILGYGSIGRQVARVAKAMGMEVVAFTATPKETRESRRDRGFIVPGTGDAEGEIPVEWYSGLDKKSLHHFLKQELDWLLVSVPLTEQTKGMLSTEEFEVISQSGKRPAFISNIARGPIIDQPALIKALKDKTLAGAALDVTDPEPLPADSELWDMPNVTITPHISGNGSSYVDRAFKVFEENLERREKGESLLNVVKRSRGY